jgi:hypothetical protein
MQSEAIEAIGPGGKRLRLEFTWRRDRYGHRISLTAADGAIQPLLESIEGSPHDDWPPSPPLQSLTIENRPNDRPVALLLGMAGGSHWSASIEAVPGKTELIFDIACRHGANPGHLGSRYRRLMNSPDDFLIRADSPKVSHEESVMMIEPLDILTSSGTTRWCFILSAES